jgi:hypothetical protein
MKTTRLHRRTLLRGLGIGAAAIALPPLEAMFNGRGRLHDEAHAAGVDPPKRFVVLHWPQGVPTGWAPTDGAWFPTKAGLDWPMSECLKPLEPYRADFNIVSGITYRQIAEHFDSHGHAIALTSGYRADPVKKIARGVSVEKIVGAAVGAGTRFSSISTGLYDQGDGFYNWENAGGEIKFSPVEVNPATLFSTLFGGAALDPDQGAAAARRAQSVLDSVKGDVGRLEKVLGAGDKRRLDEYLASIRDLEKAISTPIAANCAKPSQPASVKYTDADCTAYAKLMMDLVVMAIRCDMTRSAFMSLGGVWRTYPHIGVLTDYHNVCHSGFNPSASKGPRIDDGPNPAETRAKYYRLIATWHMEMVAYLMSLLKATDGTLPPLLDSTVMVALSEFGDGGLHYDTYIPVICAGKAGATGASAMKTGYNLAFPCSNGEDFTNATWCKSLPGTPNRCLNDVWQSALMAMGALKDGQLFGDPTLPTKPLEGLWV